MLILALRRTFTKKHLYSNGQLTIKEVSIENSRSAEFKTSEDEGFERFVPDSSLREFRKIVHVLYKAAVF